MQVLESSDRRRTWQSVGEYVETAGSSYRLCRETPVRAGYFLEETQESLQLEDTVLEDLSFLSCEFHGGRWIRVRAQAVELTHVVFRHVFFQNVDFSQATLRHTRFEHCIFLGCKIPQGEGCSEVGCLELEAAPAAAEVKAEAVLPPSVSTVAVSSAPAAVPDRFDGLERG